MIYDTGGSSARDCFPLLLGPPFFIFYSSFDRTPAAATSVFNDITKFVSA